MIALAETDLPRWASMQWPPFGSGNMSSEDDGMNRCQQQGGIQKQKRRPNSCYPCKASKTKCNGERPACSYCQSRKKSPGTKCEYPPPRRSRAAQKLNDTKSLQRSAPSTGAGVSQLATDPDAGSEHALAREIAADQLSLGTFEWRHLASSIDDFKSLRHVHGSTSQPKAVEDCTGINALNQLSLCHISGGYAMPEQSAPHFWHHNEPTSSTIVLYTQHDTGLHQIASRILALRQAVCQGKLVDAWHGLSSLVPFAESKGLNMKECTSSAQLDSTIHRRRLMWWWILTLDVEASLFTGLPLITDPGRDTCRPDLSTLMELNSTDRELEQLQIAYTSTMLTVLDTLSPAPGPHHPALSENDQKKLTNAYQSLCKTYKSMNSMHSSNSTMTACFPAGMDRRIEVASAKMMLACALAKQPNKVKTEPSEADMPKIQFTIGTEGFEPGRKAGRRGLDHHVEILESAKQVLETFMSCGPCQPEDKKMHSHTWIQTFSSYSAVAIMAIAKFSNQSKPDSDHHLVVEAGRRLCLMATSQSTCRAATFQAEKILELIQTMDTTRLAAQPRNSARGLTSQKAIPPRSKGSKARGRRQKRKAGPRDKGCLDIPDEPARKRRQVSQTSTAMQHQHSPTQSPGRQGEAPPPQVGPQPSLAAPNPPLIEAGPSAEWTVPEGSWFGEAPQMASSFGEWWAQTILDHTNPSWICVGHRQPQIPFLPFQQWQPEYELSDGANYKAGPDFQARQPPYYPPPNVGYGSEGGQQMVSNNVSGQYGGYGYGMNLGQAYASDAVAVPGQANPEQWNAVQPISAADAAYRGTSSGESNGAGIAVTVGHCYEQPGVHDASQQDWHRYGHPQQQHPQQAMMWYDINQVDPSAVG